jgi:signal transduction histidine kinase
VRLHEGGKEVAVNTIVVLEPLLKKVVNAIVGQGPKLTFESSVSGIAVIADEERLRAVLAHLIDNALEAAANGGDVTVRLAAREGDAIIEVEDTGIGMDEEFVRNELFRPFRTTKEGGFGIGAFESREFVRELGGRMEVISAPNEGTIIRISLPAMQGAESADRKLQDMEVQ